MKITAIILLIITGGLTYLSFNLFQSPPSLGYLFHLYNALFIFILGIILYFIGKKKFINLVWVIPVLTSLSIVLITVAMSNNDAIQIIGLITTGVSILATIYTVIKAITTQG